MHPPASRLLMVPALAALLAFPLASPARGQARRPGPSRRPVTRPAPAGVRKPPPPVKPAAPVPAILTAAALVPLIKAAGYPLNLESGYARVRVEEESYGYFIDFSISKSGDWLACLAYLAPIQDLTKVPAAPLLSLLSANDDLLGMYFSYDRQQGQIVLNAAVPNRGLNPNALRSLVEGMKTTIREKHGLWDPAAW